MTIAEEINRMIEGALKSLNRDEVFNPFQARVLEHPINIEVLL